MTSNHEVAGSNPAGTTKMPSLGAIKILREQCSRCKQLFNTIRFASHDGFICHRCKGKERKQKRRNKMGSKFGRPRTLS